MSRSGAGSSVTLPFCTSGFAASCDGRIDPGGSTRRISRLPATGRISIERSTLLGKPSNSCCRPNATWSRRSCSCAWPYPPEVLRRGSSMSMGIRPMKSVQFCPVDVAGCGCRVGTGERRRERPTNVEYILISDQRRLPSAKPSHSKKCSNLNTVVALTGERKIVRA
jgi:hypothetical protein